MIQVESSSFAFINWPKQLENPLHHKATKKEKEQASMSEESAQTWNILYKLQSYHTLL